MNEIEPYRPSGGRDREDRAEPGGRQGGVFTFRAFGPGRWLSLLVPAGCAGVLVMAAAVFLFVLLIVRFLWAWTIPDLFPGAVAQGLIARELSWWAAFKLAVLAGVLTGFVRRGR